MEPYLEAAAEAVGKDVIMDLTFDYLSCTELPDGKGCLLEQATEVGMGGWIPGFVINLGKSEGLKGLKYIADYITDGTMPPKY